MKISFVFPGQGSQAQGMGAELSDTYPQFANVMREGSRIVGIDLQALCNGGDLSRTDNAQLAIFAVSMATLPLVIDKKPSMLAGFSLGECSALCAAGVFSVRDGFRIVQKRGQLMQQSCRPDNAMSAIIGLPVRTIKSLMSDGASAVNYNCPDQTVIAGTVTAVSALEQKCLQMGARKAVRLRVSGAFHTHAMRNASVEFEKFLKTIKFYSPSLPVYTNTSGKPLSKHTDIPSHLAAQMCSPVLWQKSVEKMISAGVCCFVEVGAGQTLSKLIKRTDKTVKTFRTDSKKAILELREL